MPKGAFSFSTKGEYMQALNGNTNLLLLKPSGDAEIPLTHPIFAFCSGITWVV
jgi:hypothetical protein